MKKTPDFIVLRVFVAHAIRFRRPKAILPNPLPVILLPAAGRPVEGEWAADGREGRFVGQKNNIFFRYSLKLHNFAEIRSASVLSGDVPRRA